MTDLGIRVRNVLRTQSAVDRLPGLASVVTAECTRCRYRNVDPLRIARVQNDGVQAHAARARLPLGSGAMAAQSGKLLPVLSTVGCTKDRRVFHPGIDRIWIGERGFQMPYALEFPGMLRAVVKLVRGESLAAFGGGVVDELVAFAFGHAAGRGRRLAGRGSGLVPGFASVIRALNDLPEPAAGLGRINSIRISGRSLQVIHLPARKMGTADIPFSPFAVRRQDECSFACADQDSYLAHASLLVDPAFGSTRLPASFAGELLYATGGRAGKGLPMPALRRRSTYGVTPRAEYISAGL